MRDTVDSQHTNFKYMSMPAASASPREADECPEATCALARPALLQREPTLVRLFEEVNAGGLCSVVCDYMSQDFCVLC